jgi:microcystin-dependent protein
LSRGTGQGGTYVLGQSAGTESVTLSAAQNGSHTHLLTGTSAAATTATPGSSTVLATAAGSSVTVPPYGAAPGNTTLLPASIGQAGGNQPHENRQPFNTVNYIISLYGVYPSQG